MTKVLEGFEWCSISDFINSLIPTIKYDSLVIMISISAVISFVETAFGITYLAFIALMIVLVFELMSGIYASYLQDIPFSTSKLSRFTFKAAGYFVLISVPHIFYISFHERDNPLISGIFEWIHVFLVVQVVIENMFSIMENLAVIQGKPKTFWIERIKQKINSIL